KSSPLRYIEPENIMKILEKVEEVYPFINGVIIDDENFIVNRKRAVRTLELITEARESRRLSKDMKYICRTRTDNIDPELCTLLKKAGFDSVAVGSESYSKAELDEMGKHILPERNLKAVHDMLNAGLNVAENLILYTPITTPDTFHESVVQIVKNLSSLDIDGAASLFITPLPGTYYWGGGEFETLFEFPHKAQLFQDRVMFRSKKNKLDYIGIEVKVPKSDKVLPHPEIVLVNDPLMRKVSLEALVHLPETVEDLRRKAEGGNLARNFITLANIASASRQLDRLTSEPRWKQLYTQISDIMIGSIKDRK
ncbi:MAG: radical SAM protein, partial [Candidatus Woesearchaeota archaeon]